MFNEMRNFTLALLVMLVTNIISDLIFGRAELRLRTFWELFWEVFENFLRRVRILWELWELCCKIFRTAPSIWSLAGEEFGWLSSIHKQVFWSKIILILDNWIILIAFFWIFSINKQLCWLKSSKVKVKLSEVKAW